MTQRERAERNVQALAEVRISHCKFYETLIESHIDGWVLFNNNSIKGWGKRIVEMESEAINNIEWN